MNALRLGLAVLLACIQTCSSVLRGAAVPLLSPPQVQTESVLISPEDLVAASLPWQGMGSPWRSPKAWGRRHTQFDRSTSAVHNPWDIGVDEFISSGGSHSSGTALSAHPPPIVQDSADLERLPSQPNLEQHNYKIIKLQPMPISGPAMVAHGYKPNGYYKNPNVAFAAGSSMALLQIRAHLRGRVRASPKWLLNKPIAIKPSYMGQIGYTVPGNEELGLAPGVIPTLNINQPGSMAARYSVPNTRLGFDSLHAQAMSKVAPTVGTTSWLVRPVFDFDSSNKDVLNKLLYKAQIQRAAPPPAYEQVPMWPSQPPRPLFD